MTFKILDPNFVLWLWNRIKTMVKNYVTTYVSNNALASTTKYALSKDVGGAAELTVGIPFGKLDETSTSTVMTATVPGITELKSGVCMFLMNGKVTSASGYTININGLGAKPVYSTLSAATRTTTLFNVAYTGFFVFNEERVEGGCWDFYYGYNSDTNTVGYVIRTNYHSLPMTDKLYRYRLVFTSADGTHFVPADTSTSTNAISKRDVNQTPINPFGEIAYYYYTTVINAEARPGVTYLYQQYQITFGYSFNRTGAALTMTAWKPVYVKATPQSDGSAIIDADEPYVQDLPTSEDGYIYIFLGVAYNATTMELMIYHPVYYFKDGAIRLWTNQPAIEKSITETLGAGTALDLQDNEGTETTFFKRLSGGSNNVPSGLATIRGMKGKTVKWNQLNDAQKTIAETTSHGVTFHVDNYKIYANGQGDGSAYIELYSRSNIGAVKGHKYCIRMDSSSHKLYFVTYLGGYREQYTSEIFTQTADVTDTINRIYIRLNARTTFNNEVITLPQLFDLTLIFGAGNEPETVEEFEAWLAENVGLQDYYEYSEPTMLSADANSLETVGFNQWDGTYSQDNSWYNANMNTVAGDTNYAISNFISVFPNTEYFIKGTQGANVGMAFYDKDKVNLKQSIAYSNRTSFTFTTPTNAAYLKFSVYKSLANQTNLNLSWSGIRNGEYEEYWKHTYPINVKQLTSNGTVIFPNGLNRVGDAYDEIVCKNGVYKAIKRIGCVDLGTLTWERISSTSYGDMTDWFEVKSFVNTYHAIAKTNEIHHITGKYVSAPTKIFTSRILADKEIMLYTDNILYLRDDSYTTAAAFKTAMSGVLLFYELATPQEFTLYNFPCNYKVDKWGTEEMVCEGTALRPYITLSYGLNAVEKLKNFPLPPISCRVVNGALVVDNAEPYLAMGYKPMVFRWMRRNGRVTVNRNAESKSEKYYNGTNKRGWITYIPINYALNYKMPETPFVRIVPAHMEYDGEKYSWVDGKSTDGIDNTHSVLEVFDFDFQNDGIYYKNPMYLVTITVKNLGVTIGWGKDSKRLAKRDSTNESWYGFHNAYCRFGIGFVKRYPDKIEDVTRSGLLVSNIAKFGVYHLVDGGYSGIFDEKNWHFAR